MDRSRFFDHHAGGWDENRHPEEDASLARVVALAGVEPGQAVLDVGTGTGVLVPHLLAALGPAGSVVAVDLSPEMLRVARQKGFPPTVSFLEADVHDLPLPAAHFDRVICNAAFPHFDRPAESLQEMVRVLRPGGTLVISHPIGRAAVNRLHAEAGGPVQQDRVPSPEMMTALLRAAGLTDIQVVDEPAFYFACGRKAPGEPGPGKVIPFSL